MRRVGWGGLLGGAGIIVLAVAFALGVAPVPPSAVPPGTYTGAVPASPVRPSSGFTLSESGIDPVAVGLSWTESTDLVFDHYEVDQSTGGPNGSWSAIDNISAVATTSTVVTPLAPGSSSWYRVVDYAFLAGTTTSNTLAVTLPAVAQLSYSGLTASSVRLTWTNPATYGGPIAFHDYAVGEAVNGSAYTTVASLTNVGTLAFTVSGLAPATGYSFEVNTTDRCCGGTPLSSTSNPITVGTPTPLTASALARPTDVDAGQTVAFDCSVAGGVPPYAYAWNFGDGEGGSGASTTHVFAGAGTYTATCNVTDASHALTSALALVSVSPAPSVAIEAGRTMAAPGSPLNFTAVPSGGSGTYAGVDWRFGDGTTASGSTVDHAWGHAGNYMVSAEVHDSNGAAATGTLAVRVGNVSANASVNATSGEPSSMFRFTAAGGGGAGPAYRYSWNFGDGTNGTGAEVNHTYPGAGSYTASVQVVDALGARAYASAPTVRIYYAIIATIEMSTPAPTTGEAVTLNAHVAGGSGSYTCTWSIPGAAPVGGCTTVHTWDASGRYPVVLIVRDPSAGNASTTAAVVVTGPTVNPPGSPPSSGGSSHVWVLGLLAIPVLVVLWQIARRSGGSRPSGAAGATTPAGPTAPPPGPGQAVTAPPPLAHGAPPPGPRAGPSPPAAPAPTSPAVAATLGGRCPNCGSPVPVGAPYCPQCERRMSER